MSGKRIVFFFAFLGLALGDNHCPHDQFATEDGMCENCDQRCMDGGGGCKGPGLEGCLFVCPCFREEPMSVPIFLRGIRIHDDDHNQIHKMTEAEFFFDNFESLSDAMYVSLVANTSDTDITSTYDAATGKLTLTGLDYVSNYNKVLGSIQFRNTAPTPDLQNRRVIFSVNDGDQWSKYYLVIVKIKPINNHSPQVYAEPADEAYNEHGSPVNVFENVAIHDADHEDIFPMAGATISVLSPPDGDCFGSQLIHVDLGSYGDKVWLESDNPASVIRLVGNASADIYEHIIETAKFHSNGSEPPRGSVTIKLEIDDGKFTNNTNVTIAISTINDSPPKIGGIDSPVFIAREPAVFIADGILLTDCDDNNVHKWTKLEVMLATITSDYPDEILHINTGSIPTILETEVTDKHILLVPNNNETEAPVADFERAVRTLTYDNSNENISCPLERDVRLRIWDGIHMTEENIIVTIAKSNKNAPTFGVSITGASFSEDGPPVALLTSVRIADLDQICDILLMSGAEVNMTAPDEEHEKITFSSHDQIKVDGPVDNGGGTWKWTVTGNAHADEYEAYIRSIMYRNTKDEPTMTPHTRTLWIRIFDGMFYSDRVEIVVDIRSRNDQPPKLISPVGMVYNFTENDGPTVLDQIYLEDDDSYENDRKVNIINVWIDDVVDGDFEHLLVNENTTTLPADITVTSLPSSFRVEIKGKVTGNFIPEFYSVLQTLRYENVHYEPTPGRRRIRFQILSDAIGDAREVNVDLYMDVFGVNDSPTTVVLPEYVYYTERSDPVHVAPNAMLWDADKQPLNVAIVSIDVSFDLDHESGSKIYCDGCPNFVTLMSIGLTASFGGQGWQPQKVAELVRNITFAIVRPEPPKLANTVEVTFEITDIDGNTGTTAVEVRVQHICDPSGLILNETAMSSMSMAYFSEFTPSAWVHIVEGPVKITNNDSDYIVEAEIAITGGHDAGRDELAIAGSPQWSVNLTSGVLRISGVKSLNQMEYIIGNITFRNVYECRLIDPRTVTIRLKDDCGAWSNTGEVTIHIITNNDRPIVLPADGSRDPLEYTYTIQGVKNLNPPMLVVFPHLKIDDCDGPNQGNLSMVNVTIMDAPDWPNETIHFNQTMLAKTGLKVKAVEVNEHVVRYMIYHPSGTAPISSFETVIRHSYYINSADCPFEVARKIILTASDGEDSGEGYAMINFHRNPVGPKLWWNESIVRQWTGQATTFYLLDDGDNFGIIPGDIHFIHKALVTITNPIKSASTTNFRDIVYIHGDDEASVESLGLKMTPILPETASEFMLEFNGPVSSVDAATFEDVLRKVRFDSGDIDKNCDRIIAVTVWDSPLKRKSNTIYVKVIVGDRPEPIGCNATEAQTTDDTTSTPVVSSSVTPSTSSALISTSTPVVSSTPPPPPPPPPPSSTSMPITSTPVMSSPPSQSTSMPITSTPVVSSPPSQSTSMPTTSTPVVSSPLSQSTSMPTTSTPVVSSMPLPSTCLLPTATPAVEPLVDCPGNTISLTDQTSVDQLGATECNRVNGDLVINCGFGDTCYSPFFSLVNLRNIAVITGKLLILTNRMKTLEGLENITSFAAVELNDNTELETTKHLRMNTHEQGIKVSEISVMGGHSHLEDIDGLKGITEVTGNVLFTNLPSLKSLAGLSHLRSVCNSDSTGDFTLEKINEGDVGAVVENLGHLSCLQQVCGVLKVYVTEVTTLEGLSSLTKVGSIQVRSNNELTSAGNGLSSVEVITGVGASTQGGYSVLIYGNPSLTTMGDFAKANGALDSVTGKLMIHSNSKLCFSASIFSVPFWDETGATTDGSRLTKGTNCAKRRK